MCLAVPCNFLLIMTGMQYCQLVFRSQAMPVLETCVRYFGFFLCKSLLFLKTISSRHGGSIGCHFPEKLLCNQSSAVGVRKSDLICTVKKQSQLYQLCSTGMFFPFSTEKAGFNLDLKIETHAVLKKI